MTLEEHVLFRALALVLPQREVLKVIFEERILFRASALGLFTRDVQIRDP